MKEKIYTIPVTEAFEQDSECPVCLLEKKLEAEYTDYYLGPALMEADCRIETNKKGFCRRHFEMMYNRQENRLGLALETDTHLKEQLKRLKEFEKGISDAAKSSKPTGSIISAFTGMRLSKNRSDGSAVTGLINMLTELEKSCTVCDRLSSTMDRYMDVIMYLWSKEDDFRKLFSAKKGFCLIHMRMMAEASVKYLKPHESAEFVELLFKQQVENLERIEKELDWFAKKFDYRYNDSPWGNSRDALPRGIQKLKGFCDLK